MKTKKLAGSVLLLFFALIFHASAVDYGLSGYVLDSSGSAISGASVTIVGVASNTSVTDGAYGFTNVSSSTYTVYAEKSGYYRQVRSITLNADTVQNFTLSAPNYTILDMDDIVIDLTGNVLVEVKGDVPTIVDLGVLYFIMILLIMIVGAIIALFLIVPKMIQKRKRR